VARNGLAALLVLALTVSLGPAVAASPAAPGDIGYLDGATGGGEPTGSKRTESALWFNGGGWGANMWSPLSADFHIFRLDTTTQQWRDTGVLVDGRHGTSGDTLWDGSHLYISSHVQSATARTGTPSYLFRFSYDPATQTYSRDSGFPVQLNNSTSETLTIDKDSTGMLWATWMQGDRIYVDHTLAADTIWGTPFPLTVANSTVTSDDISALVAFGGDRIGVMWGNQTAATDGYYFSVHRDGQPDTAWGAPELALGGPGASDDHINLKADSAGTVYAAVKTSHTSAAQPLTMLLVRAPGGAWSSHPVDTVSNCPNRPIVVVDESARVAHVFETGPTPPALTCTSSGGDIYEKTASLDSLAFGSGLGTPVIRPADAHFVHNVSSTKQPVSRSSGLVALAPDLQADVYWHSFDPLGFLSAPTAAFAASPTAGPAPLDVRFNDASAGSPTSWAWTFGDGSSSAEQNPVHRYAAQGTYTVTLTVSNGFGTDSATRSGYIAVGPAPAATTTFKTTADARVSRAEPTTNFGAATTLRVKTDTYGATRSYIRFAVAGLAGPVLSAKLRLFVKDPGADGGSIVRVLDDAWSEAAITWNTAPAMEAVVLSGRTAATDETWVEYDVTGAVGGTGPYDFGITGGNSDSVYYSSREGAHAPELVVATGG
jgi:PKD repeat protein